MASKYLAVLPKAILLSRKLGFVAQGVLYALLPKWDIILDILLFIYGVLILPIKILPTE